MKYQAIETPNGRGQCLPDSPLFHFLQSTDPAIWFRSIPDEKKHGVFRNSCLQEFHSDTGGSQTIFCKLYPVKKKRQALAARFGYFKSRGIFQLTRHLCENGLRTPRPIAHFMCRAGHRDGSFIFLETLQDAVDLRYVIEDGARDQYFRDAGLLEKSIDLMAELHGMGVCHRDYKFGNLLWQAKSKQLYLIDFDGARRFGEKNDIKARARDLARFTLACHQVGMMDVTVEYVVGIYQQRLHLNVDLVRPTAETYQVLADRHYCR